MEENNDPKNYDIFQGVIMLQDLSMSFLTLPPGPERELVRRRGIIITNQVIAVLRALQDVFYDNKTGAGHP